jgi:hypothetical protein
MNDELIAEAELGDEARKFLDGDLGKWLVGCAEQEVQAAQEALETADPNNEKAIRDLQNKAWRGRRFKEWLAELVSRGEGAIAAFKQQQHED